MMTWWNKLFSLKILKYILTHLHTVLFLIIIQQHSWYHFCTDFSCAQIFGHNLPNIILFHVLQPRNHSNSQMMIVTHHLPHPLDVDFSPVCWRPPAPGVIIQLLAPLNLMCHLEICVLNMGLSPYAYWSISSACDGVISDRTKNFRFIFYSEFLLLCTKKKRCSQKKVKEKNVMVAER